MPETATADGVAKAEVAPELVQYVKVSPDVEPLVTAGNVRLIVDPEHTAAGVVITTVGEALTVTVTLVLVRLVHPVAPLDSP